MIKDKREKMTIENLKKFEDVKEEAFAVWRRL